MSRFRKSSTEDKAGRFKRLCWPFLGDLLRTARFFAPREEVAEDLVQETMLKALRAIDSFEEGTDVKAWLMTILRRTYLDHARSGYARHVVASLGVEPIAGDDADHYEAGVPAQEGLLCGRLEDSDLILEQVEDPELIRALQGLPEALRWTLLLVDVEGLEHSQAAEILGVPEGTIKSRAHRGRRILREQLTPSPASAAAEVDRPPPQPYPHAAVSR